MIFNMSTYFSVAVSVFMLHTIMLHLLLNSFFGWKDGAKYAPLKARAHKWSCDERLSRSLIKKDETQYLFPSRTQIFLLFPNHKRMFEILQVCVWSSESMLVDKVTQLLTRATHWLGRADSPAWYRKGRSQKRPPALSARLWSGLQTPWCWTLAPRLGPAWWPPSQSSQTALETDLQGDRRMADILTF